ncbi:DUF2267 domain-containing protein [Umezakia ovalisporum]|jgi:uncharacterized protein (DUF2267 family)|uniref:hypothetical protein n=1 Tax=Umezakia ovalisporum TaxID=75695 RepID=UPI0024752F3B|nr:hypothetical protein [Umezakia ovalisporum]MBI1242348.1 hypothetical protein [Nostoc sp. RI_552]MDH6074515.1 hypothetical protein [Umezakia ovalisporum CS-1034]MDH6089040.1 hypothetical protein [Umezakia ovalisporum Ak1311]MDH6104109.1 hypothetical protein [Umezakia ovalisporum ANA283AFssAo]
MQHNEFIAQVQNHAHLPSRGEAELPTPETLGTLGEVLVGALLAGSAERANAGETFCLDELFQSIS